MRKPASFRRFLTIACYNACAVQVATGVLIVLHSLGAMFLGERHMSGPPGWIFGLGVALSLLAASIAWVQYRRGDLDEYDNRRQRAGERAPAG